MSIYLMIGFVSLLAFALLFINAPLTCSKSFRACVNILFITGVSVGYYFFGGFDAYNNHLQKIKRQTQARLIFSSLKNKDIIIEKLQNQINKDVNNPKGWYLLGRIYASKSQWILAEQAFFKAYTLSSYDQLIAVNYGLSLYQNNHQQFNEKIRSLYQKILKKDSHQPDSLAMLAMDAYLSGQWNKAIHYWQTLLSIIGPDTEEGKMIKDYILKAQRALDNS